MKNIWNKIKNCWGKLRNGFWPFLLKHDKCLYTFFATSLIFLSVIAYQNWNYTKDYLQWRKESILLIQDLKIATEIITIQGEIIKKKDEIISVQQSTLERAKEIIIIQDKAIKDLLNILEDRNEKSSPRHDASRWAIHK